MISTNLFIVCTHIPNKTFVTTDEVIQKTVIKRMSSKKYRSGFIFQSTPDCLSLHKKIHHTPYDGRIQHSIALGYYSARLSM